MANHYSWSDLPIDLLNAVVERLSIYDLVRLSALCKAWRPAALDVIRRRSNMPWIITYHYPAHIVFSKIEISYPWSKRANSLEKVVRREEVRAKLAGTNVRASKYGWLLLSRRVEKIDSSYSCCNTFKLKKPRTSTLFLFYNPLHNKIIEMPPLHLDIDKHEAKVTFSTMPTCPTCVVFVLIAIRESYIIKTCNPTGKKWGSFHTSCPCDGKIGDLTYVDEILYCVFDLDSSLKLGTFNVTLQEWDVKDYCFGKNLEPHYLVEFDGELLLAFYYLNGNEFYWRIYQYDRSRKHWTRMRSLGNRVLFMQLEFPCGSSSMVVPAVGEASEFANMVFFLGWSACKSYSCRRTEGDWRLHRTYKWDRKGFNSWIKPLNYGDS